MSRIVGVIPARWGSTRFPGKPLAPIAGKPLLAWVVERTRLAGRLDAILVATDDERIAALARSCGVAVAMTRSDHPSGTDRIAEALQGDSADIVINVQGDEPLMDPDLVNSIAAALSDAREWDMATAAAPLTDEQALRNPDVVKVVRADDGRALYFSRAPIPFERDAPPGQTPSPGGYLRHIGIYGYRRDFLERLVRQPPCRLELMEKLEQLRALNLGGRIRVLDDPGHGIGVDSPEDVPRAEALLRAAGLL